MTQQPQDRDLVSRKPHTPPSVNVVHNHLTVKLVHAGGPWYRRKKRRPSMIDEEDIYPRISAHQRSTGNRAAIVVAVAVAFTAIGLVCFWMGVR